MTGTRETTIQTYFDIIDKRYQDGKITEDKFGRLYDKLQEWQAYAERNVGRR